MDDFWASICFFLFFFLLWKSDGACDLSLTILAVFFKRDIATVQTIIKR